jgi:ATP/maltotriose-dependent transcriptional regulator MalT
VHEAQLTQVRLYQGRGEEVTGPPGSLGPPDPPGRAAAAGARTPVGRAALAAAYCWLGRRAEAAAVIEQEASRGFEEIGWDQARTTSLALYADAASQAGRPAAAEALYRLLEPWQDHVIWNGAVGYGFCRVYLGLLAATLGWEHQADEHLAIACEFHETKDMPLWAARSHLGWAESLLRRGETHRAGREAARALELAREHGYLAFEPRATAIAASGHD